MEMNLEINIAKISTKVKLAEGRDDNILAFAELYFYEYEGTNPFIKVKGITIKKKDFEGTKVISVVFPGYRAGKSFQTSFVLPNKNFWSDVCDLLLKDYYSLGGQRLSEINPTVASLDEILDLDEVDEGIKRMKGEA